ncbi:MAG TPA: hypothetical protein DCQ06_09750, partial [Myxococcales bacterium]|nr:hypothetical protein [Myxococcales bacterium]
GLQTLQALEQLVGQRVEQWQVRRSEVLAAGSATLWVVKLQSSLAAPVRLLCREPGQEQKPAVAHSDRFDLRLDGKGRTPNGLGQAVESLAGLLKQIESEVQCSDLQPSGVVKPQVTSARDERLTVKIERLNHIPLRDLALLWLTLWGLAWIWALRRQNRPYGIGPPSSSERSATLRYVWLALFAGALLCRLYKLGEFTLNPDEHASIDASPWIDVFRGDDDSLYHPPLARAIFRGWYGIWGWLSDSLVPRWWWRLPSVIGGMAAIVGLSRLLPTARLALAAAALLAFSPHGVFISDLAKPYALTSAAFIWALVALNRGSTLWAALFGALICWLDYVAGLAWFATCAAAALSASHRRVAIASASSSALAALPLVPLALTGVQYAVMRNQRGWSGAVSGFPAAPGLLPADGVAGRGLGELLMVAVGCAEPVAWWVCGCAAFALIYRSIRGDEFGRLCRHWAIGVGLWLALGWLISQRVYLRPQNLAFALFALQGALALAAVATWQSLPESWTRRIARPPWLALALLIILSIARVPQFGALYANQRSSSVADMNFGPDCQRAAMIALHLGGDVIVQVDGDAHCMMVEVSSGAPHQRAFAKAGHLPSGGPCQYAQNRRWCAGGSEAQAFCDGLKMIGSVVAVVDRHKAPLRPARCTVADTTGDFEIWRCASGRPASDRRR